MKSIKHLLCVAGILSLTLVSCYKDQINDLQTQIDEVKNTQIKSVNDQISSIKTSISKLESTDTELKGFISTLQAQAAELEKTDESLGKSIKDLKTELYSAISSAKLEVLNKLDSEKKALLAEINANKSKIAALEAKDAQLAEKDADLQSQIDGLKGELAELQTKYEEISAKAASIESELSQKITTAEANCLAQLEAYKTSVNNQLVSINTTIATLQAKDEDLQKQINNLKTYVDSGIQDAKDWASATFATLEQYNATAGIVATIQSQIATLQKEVDNLDRTTANLSKEDLDNAIAGLRAELRPEIQKMADDAAASLQDVSKKITAAYTKAISEAISASEKSIKSWVNTQLAGYYTAAQVDSKLSSLKISLEGQLNSQKTYLTGLIKNLESTLSSKISANKTLIDGLQSQLNGLSSELSELSGKVSSNSRAISDNASKISANSLAISRNANDIDACEKLIAANKKLIAENESAISANSKAIKALQSRATENERKIAQNVSDIAQNASDIASNASLIATNAAAITNNAQAISANAEEIQKLKDDLAQTRKDITAAYTKAIDDAINTLGGQLRGEIATEVNNINGRIDREVSTINSTIETLTARVQSCEKDIKSIKNTIYAIQQDLEDIHEQISDILARVQSITFVPKYSDGKAVMTYTKNTKITAGAAEFDFEMKPASTAAEIVNVWQSALSMKAVYTITKAAPQTVDLAIESVTAENGFLNIVVSGKSLKDEFFKSQCSANVRLSISDGNNDLTTDYIQMVPWTTDVISFADAGFKAYCVENFDTDGDGEISEDEAKGVTAIDCSLANLTSLVGIEYFSNLETIDVSCNKLTSLDLSNSPKLTQVLVNNNSLQSLTLSGLSKLVTLDCSSNKLGSIDVSECESLESLKCNANHIGTLNLKNNKALTELQCNNNAIAQLNLKNNVRLETLYCRKNDISVLNVTGLAHLKNFDCSNNALTSLNVYKNAELETLYCASNALTSLGITANVKLTNLDCSNNQLTALDVSKNVLLETINCSNNALTSLDVSRNAVLNTLTCHNNASMAKLWVKDAAQKAEITVKKDDTTMIAYNDGGINIPDAKLKEYLLALFDDDEDGEISIFEAENIQNVNCSGRGITSLVGLQDCPNLKYLNFNGNSVKEVELPNLSKLETIVAYGNPIERLNVNNDTALTALYLQNVSTNALSGTTFTITAYDQAQTLELAFAGTAFTTLNLTGSSVLTSFDIAENIQLEKLVASGNSLVTGVNVSTLTALTHLDLNACGLTSLDVDTNVELTYFDCSSNKLTSLNVNNNVALVTFDCSDNQLSSLKVSNNASLEKLDVSRNQLLNVNVRNNRALLTFNISDNAGVSALALGYNTVLETLEAANTALTDIDLSKNAAVKNLNLSGCANMHIIDLSKNEALETLNVSKTSIEKLDLSKNVALESLDVSGTFLESLDVNGCPLLRIETTKALPIIGQWVVPNGVKGVVFYSRDSVVKIVSIDETNAEWGYYGTTTGATSSVDGAANTDKIVSGSPAAKWCRAKGAEWYLPAKDELKEIYNKKSAINTTLSSISGTALANSGYYWSSTDYSSNYACYVDFSNGDVIGSSKYYSYKVRAVRAL